MYDQQLFDCHSNPKNFLFSFFLCPCAFAELYTRRRKEADQDVKNYIVSFLASFVPLVNCFFVAKERQGIQADSRIQVESMGLIWLKTFCLWGCILSQDRNQYMKDVGEPTLMTF